ncbi:hypothetical protein [Pseudofulvibacter geojedonensis]|uniref:DUF342 domain-containing protein n=1 Tax=Pseudofulvibacter geojedonensis TaxID=1123758 RepID=A0ABW3I1Q1_9FLAO
MSKIYNYIDLKGIPFKKLASFSIKIEEDDILNRLNIESDETTDRIINKGELIISTHNHSNVKTPDFPNKFKLDKKAQEEVVTNWLKDTTGYIVDEFKTLFELPELNQKPFLLQIERGIRNYFLVLATKVINGDLIVKEKYHSHHGFLQENFIKTFGQIEKINGTIGIDGKMNDFGNLTEVGGDLWFSNHVYQENLKSIKPLKIVYGDLNLKNTHAALESLEEVGGNLNLRKTTCHNISSLKRVGGNILVSKNQLDNFDFSKVEINGEIKTYNDKFNQGQLTSPQLKKII